MSITYEEISSIQEWLADQYGTSVNNLHVSRETIRYMCQGPMKDVFLNFLVPRVRTNEQIKTIRSNLFLHDVAGDDNNEGILKDEDSRHTKEVARLKDEISKVHKQKQEVTKRIEKHLEKMSASNNKLEKEVVQALSLYEKGEYNATQALKRVRTTNELLKELPNLEPHMTLSQNNGTEDFLVRKAGLKSLYENALELFDLYCGAKHHSVEADSLHTAALTEKVDLQTWELANSGVPPSVIENWVESEQEQAHRQINALQIKFTNVMSPVEKFTSEVEDLNIKLMAVHVDLRVKNEELKQRIESLKKRLNKYLWDAIEDEKVTLKHLLELLEEEKKKARAYKLKEIENTVTQWERALTNDEDVLEFICQNSEQRPLNNYTDHDNALAALNRTREIMNDEASSSASSPRLQETLEELTTSLVKTFPWCKDQLKTTLRDSKRLMLDMFPKFCEKLERYMEGNADFLSNVPSVSSLDDAVSHLNIPDQILLLGTPVEEDSTYRNDDSHMKSEDSLNELIRMNARNAKIVNACKIPAEASCSSSTENQP